MSKPVDPDLTTDIAPPEVSHLALYRRWRAQTFSRIVGQDAVVTTLRNAVRTGQVAHALLFVGPRGTGKTSMARIVAKAVNCTNLQDGDPCDVCPSCVAIRDGRTLDVSELDAATNNKVDQIRELVERTWTAPSDLRRKVFIIDEVQRITDGWDVLLKTLEEPPPHVVFIFCTTDPTRIRPAVLSRVQRFEFRRLTVPQIEGKLATILAAENRQADPAAIGLVARQAAGGMRDAESMLDQLLASTSDRLTVEAVRDLLGLVDAEVIGSFLDALVRGDALAGIGVLDGLDESGRDLGGFIDQVVVALRGALAGALAGGGRATSVDGSLAALSEAGRRIATIDPSRQGIGGLRFQLELALIAAAGGPRSTDLAERAIAVSIVAEMPELDVEAGPEGGSIAARTETSGATPPARRPSRSPSSAEPAATTPRASTAASAAASAAAQAAASAEASPAAQASPAAEAPPGVVASSPASATTAPTDPRFASDTLDVLVGAWPSIVEELSKSPAIKPLIKECRPLAIDGNVVTLGYPEGQSFLRDHLERKRSTLEEGIGRIIGRPVGLRLEATNLDILPPPVDENAERLLAAARRIFADDLVDAGEVG
jgi:DNA polymerase-3 subunit gamma/tau